MKTILLSLILIVTINFSGNTQQKNKSNSNTQAKVLVYFFHGTHRCTGCINAEKATVSVLNDLYKNQQNDGTVKFQSINIEEAQNKTLAEKYQVAWNMLLIVPVANEKDKVELTQQAFTYGTKPESLKPYIKAAIDPMLK